MNFENHCKVTKIIFGNSHAKVHRWLDGYYVKYRATKHWRYRHHIQAITDRYGEGSTEYLVAYLHILCDWMVQTAHAFVPRTPEEIEPELAKCNVELVKAMLLDCDRGTF